MAGCCFWTPPALALASSLCAICCSIEPIMLKQWLHTRASCLLVACWPATSGGSENITSSAATSCAAEEDIGSKR